MRITKLSLKAGASEGLKPGVMDRLGPVVALAGPNGAGKSRILRLVARVAGELSNRGRLTVGDDVFNELFGLGHPRAAHLSEDQRTSARVDLERELAKLQQDEGHEVTAFRGAVPILFFPDGHTSLGSPQQLNPQQLEDSAQVPRNASARLGQNATAYLCHCAQRYQAATHPHDTASESEKANAVAQWDKLKRLVQAILGTDMTFNLGKLHLFGMEFAPGTLSAGQKILLQLVVALHAQTGNLDGQVLMLDEPENHLHPSALLDVLKRLRDLNPNGQLWLATHSLPLLASLEPNCVWYVDAGGVTWAGRNPEVVVDGLLGGADGREQLADYLRLPAELATLRFAAQCLFPPQVILTAPAEDPQATAARDILSAARKPQKVLDFGAGAGRLFKALRDSWRGEEAFVEAVDYRAYDLRPPDGLRAVLEMAYGGPTPQRVYDADNFSKFAAQSADVVLMVNVLHEVPPEQWPTLFSSSGQVTSALKPDGYLLLIEDMEIPHGEKAHRNGFLLLDNASLHAVLGCGESDSDEIRTFDALGGRVKAHVVPRSLLGRTDQRTVVHGLRVLARKAQREVAEIRKKEPDSRSGRLHGLWTQQLANAHLGLEALGEALWSSVK